MQLQSMLSGWRRLVCDVPRRGCAALGLAAALASAVLAGCATRAALPPVGGLLHDALFAAPAEPVDPARVFALTDAMRRYAATELHPDGAQRDPRRKLIEALYSRRQLQLSYDAGSTRDAAQAFEARAGNCLSLVIMTAAFAKHLGLPVTFQAVLGDELFTRAGTLTLASGHVNLVLGKLAQRSLFAPSAGDELTVDFLPASELRGQRTLPIEERTIVAMYFNNRAAEALADGSVADSYAFARAAVLADPGFHAAVNTLAVVYMRGSHVAHAEAALRHALLADAENTAALSNLRTLLQRAGRSVEADAVAARLAQLQPYPPFHFFELGRRAMAAGDYAQARDLFARELRRQPYQHEVHFWAAQAWWLLGNRTRAADHLRLALENSTTPRAQGLYTAKLDRLRALRVE